LIVLLLLPRGRQALMAEPAPHASAPVAPAAPLLADDISLALDSLDADEGWTPAEMPPPAQPVPVPVEPSPVQTSPMPAEPSVDLQAVATVCNDLARVVDTRALPALLERTAGVLDASGIILWIADPDGRELAPIVT